MSEKPENEHVYFVPRIANKNMSREQVLFYDFADVLIEQQSTCSNIEKGDYEREFECIKSKQKLAKATDEYFEGSSHPYDRAIKKMVTLKKLMDVNMQKNNL